MTDILELPSGLPAPWRVSSVYGIEDAKGWEFAEVHGGKHMVEAANLIASIPAMVEEIGRLNGLLNYATDTDAYRTLRRENDRLRAQNAELRESLEEMESYSHYCEAWQDEHPEIPERARTVLKSQEPSCEPSSS